MNRSVNKAGPKSAVLWLLFSLALAIGLAAPPSAAASSGSEGGLAVGGMAVNGLATQSTRITGDFTITEDGEYSVAQDASGTITVSDGRDVVLVGEDADASWDGYADLSVQCGRDVRLTLRDISLRSNSTETADTPFNKSTVNFSGGTDNVLDIEGTVLLDRDTNATGKAAVHVGPKVALSVVGSGTLYLYKREQGAGIGGDDGEVNGTITFGLPASQGASKLRVFAKGSKQGALIGAGANAGSAKAGDIVFNSGEYNLIAVARGSAVGGSAGAGGASDGGNVRVEGGTLSINVDFSGSAIGGGGFASGNDADGGVLFADGGSVRAYVDENGTGSWRDYGITSAGVDDRTITALKTSTELGVPEDGASTMAVLAVDTSLAVEGGARAGQNLDVKLDGKNYAAGGPHLYRFINDGSGKNGQVAINFTKDNWVVATSDGTLEGEPDDPCLYLYAPIWADAGREVRAEHVVSLNGKELRYVWSQRQGRFVLHSGAPQSLEIQPPSASLFVGETRQMAFAASPEGAFVDDAVWKSSDESVVTVDADGAVRGVAEGQATVTVEAGGVSASCQVTVKAASGVVNLSGGPVSIGPKGYSQGGSDIDYAGPYTLVGNLEQPVGASTPCLEFQRGTYQVELRGAVLKGDVPVVLDEDAEVTLVLTGASVIDGSGEAGTMTMSGGTVLATVDGGGNAIALHEGSSLEVAESSTGSLWVGTRTGYYCVLGLQEGSSQPAGKFSMAGGSVTMERADATNSGTADGIDCSLIDVSGGSLVIDVRGNACLNGHDGVSISGGLVDATMKTYNRHAVIKSDAAITITGGSVKTVTPYRTTLGEASAPVDNWACAPAPVDAQGKPVYLAKVDAASTAGVVVDGADWRVPGNHAGDDVLYLYLPGGFHTVKLNRANGSTEERELGYLADGDGTVAADRTDGFFRDAAEAKYAVSWTAPGGHGSLELSQEARLFEGQALHVVPKPEEGYGLVSLSWQAGDGSGDLDVDAADPDAELTMSMPAADMTLQASFARLYGVSVSQSEGGALPSSLSRAAAGSRVVIASEPDWGHKLASLTVRAASGAAVDVQDQGDGSFAFEMPAEDVAVSGTFDVVQNMASWEIGSSDASGVVARLSGDGVLRFEGSGNTKSYSSNSMPPWCKGPDFLKNRVVRVEFAEGVRPTTLSYWFYGCPKLVEVGALPDSITTMNNTFRGCTSLVEAPAIPFSVTSMVSCFELCTSLRCAPQLPPRALALARAFYGCTSLSELPEGFSVLANASVANMFGGVSGASPLETVCTASDYASLRGLQWSGWNRSLAVEGRDCAAADGLLDRIASCESLLALPASPDGLAVGAEYLPAASHDALENARQQAECALSGFWEGSVDAAAARIAAEELQKATDQAQADVAVAAESEPGSDPQPAAPVDIARAKVVLAKASCAYNGKMQAGSVQSVTLDGAVLRSGVDYTVTAVSGQTVGSYEVVVTGKGLYTGTVATTFTIAQADNTLSASGKTVKVKLAKVKKAKQVVAAKKAMAVSQARGPVSYKKLSGNKKVTVNAKTGKVTVKKGLKKGTYKVKVQVSAKGDADYKAGSKTVVFKLKVA